MFKGVERLENRLYSGDRDEITARVETLMLKGSLQLNSMRWVIFIKRLLHTLHLVNSDADVNSLVRRCNQATNVNGSAYIVIISLNDFNFVLLLRGWSR